MNHWSDEIEEICEKLRVNCVNLSEYHRRRYYHFKSYGKWFRLPLIILASVNSTASVGLQPVLEQQIISGITCLLGMIMGIIGSLELYLGIQASMELELKQSKEFYTLAISLYKTLALQRENRLEDGKEYLNEKYSLYTKLCESSNLLDREMKTDLLAHISEEQRYKSPTFRSAPKLMDINASPLNLKNLKQEIKDISNEIDDSPLKKQIVTTNDAVINVKESIFNNANSAIINVKENVVRHANVIDICNNIFDMSNNIIIDISNNSVV